ncbi:ArsR/SmtB family transcription factor [Rhizobium jaguaris]|uniref:ArsR family transcriptional regulator n=1 Tax=Rhizobium jaguaris TaxID=1312183 RepID=A0A387FH01_9HYPH|nr:helix-turn-helix domain-containing protein [Rhizobium jaguaris]AYG57633.1 ArsR family transcriptional regulator [Rhizobium jaguaris]
MLKHGDSADKLSGAAPLFSALGDPVRLAIVARLCKDGPLPTIELKQCADGVSRQGVTKHLHVLEDVGLVDSDRIGRDRQWRLRAQQFSVVRDYLDWISTQWDERLERLRAFVEDDASGKACRMQFRETLNRPTQSETTRGRTQSIRHRLARRVAAAAA